MSDEQTLISLEAAERFLDQTEALAELALDESWERWYWFDSERILLEAADLTLPVFLLPEAIGLGTFERIANETPMMLRAWENTEKLYLAAHHHGGEDPTMRYFIDVATPEREIAEWFVDAKGGGKIRTKEEVLAEPWPCQQCPMPLSGRPNMADALQAWERGDDEIPHVLTRRFAEAFDPVRKAKEGRAKLRWGMIPGVEA
jgi:hypothetical protein